MKIMSNHIYSANISASIALEAEKANIIRFDNLRNQKLAARSHIPPK